MLCLIAGGEHHAPLSVNRVERPKLRIPGEDFGGGTNFLACRLLVFATRQERVVKAGLKCELRRATSKVLIVGVLDHLLPFITFRIDFWLSGRTHMRIFISI